MKSRWLVFLPVAALALWGQPAKADATHNLWTCWASSTDQWTMLQPMEHFRAGYYPTWSDCINWRYGSPAEPYTWSYGLTNVATTTTAQTTTTVETTTTLGTTTTWESSTTSTTSTTTSTTTVPETTVPAQTSTSSTTSTSTTSTSTTTTTTQAPPPPPPTTTSTTTSTTVPETSTSSSTTTSQPETTTTSTTTTSLPRPSTTVPTPSTAPPTTETTVTPTTSVPAVPLPQIAQVANLSVAQATEVFAELDVTELDNTEIEALVAAVQDAPTEVREAFEKEVDVFAEGLDDYVPLGSEVPVSTRRTLIAVAIGATMTAVGGRRR